MISARTLSLTFNECEILLQQREKGIHQHVKSLNYEFSQLSINEYVTLIAFIFLIQQKKTHILCNIPLHIVSISFYTSNCSVMRETLMINWKIDTDTEIFLNIYYCIIQHWRFIDHLSLLLILTPVNLCHVTQKTHLFNQKC